MTDPVNVVPFPTKKKTAALQPESPLLLENFVFNVGGAWAIRHHADGSWSVGGEPQAANDPDMTAGSSDSTKE